MKDPTPSQLPIQVFQEGYEISNLSPSPVPIQPWGRSSLSMGRHLGALGAGSKPGAVQWHLQNVSRAQVILA